MLRVCQTERPVNALLFEELTEGSRRLGRPLLRFKDTLTQRPHPHILLTGGSEDFFGGLKFWPKGIFLGL